jgi:hypothetical protein
LKARFSDVLSTRINVRFLTPRPAQPTPSTIPFSSHPPSPQYFVREDAIVLVSNTALADGCPSVVRPLDFPASTADEARASPVRADPTPLARRGAVSNQLPVALMPALPTGLFGDCQKVCLLSRAGAGPIQLDIERAFLAPRPGGGFDADIGGVEQPVQLRPRRYWGPNGELLHRDIWIGAVFDRELRIANRFPLFGCAYTLGDSWGDFRGATARPAHAPLSSWVRWGASDPRWRPFGGVFVSVGGPPHAANLLLAEPLLTDYLKHLVQYPAVIAAMRLSDEDTVPLVPKPQDLERKAR